MTNLPTELLWGENAIEEELCGLRFRVRPNAFLQTNTAMAERLYELAAEAAGLTGRETVWDLYCGIGTIGLSLASQALTVWGIDVSEESIACALENADLNGIANAALVISFRRAFSIAHAIDSSTTSTPQTVNACDAIDSPIVPIPQ